MRPRSPAVLITLLIVVAFAASASAGPTAVQSNETSPRTEAETDPGVVTAPGTTNYLVPSSLQQERYARADVDVAGASAATGSQFRIRLFNRSVFARFQAAPNTSAKTRVLENATDAIENMSRILREQQAEAVGAYSSGEISADVFFRRIAVIDTRADRLESVVESIPTRANRNPNYTLPTKLRIRLQGLQIEPRIVQGQVKSAMAESVTGGGPERFYIGTATRRYVFARTVNGRYHREAFVASAYSSGSNDGSGANEDVIPTERMRQLYPWVFENRISLQGRGFGLRRIYQFTFEHTHGRLISYFDGRNNRTFREFQDKRLSQLPISDTAVRETENLTIQTNVTHTTGPMEVTVKDTVSESAIDARVSINGMSVGRTGDDGLLWVTRPMGEVTITATRGNASVTLGLMADGRSE